MSEEERINKQIEDNIKGHEIPAPENNFAEVSEENKEAMLNAETPAREDLIRRINHTLNKIRPYLQADGGDVEFVDFQDGVVTVTMTGACAGCLMASADISEGVQAILIDEVEEVRSVKLLESTPFGYENINS